MNVEQLVERLIRSADNVEQLVERLIRSADDALWDYDDIAEYTHLGKQTVQKKFVNATGFPRAVKLPSGGRRWVAKEVKEYLKRQREPLLDERARRTKSLGM